MPSPELFDYRIIGTAHDLRMETFNLVQEFKRDKYNPLVVPNVPMPNGELGLVTVTPGDDPESMRIKIEDPKDAQNRCAMISLHPGAFGHYLELPSFRIATAWELELIRQVIQNTRTTITMKDSYYY